MVLLPYSQPGVLDENNCNRVNVAIKNKPAIPACGKPFIWNGILCHASYCVYNKVSNIIIILDLGNNSGLCIYFSRAKHESFH